MNIEEIRRKQQEICDLLAAREVKQAIADIESLIAQTQHQNHLAGLGEIAESYRKLLHYTSIGCSDESRDQNFDLFVRSLYELTASVADDEISTIGTTISSEAHRLADRAGGIGAMATQLANAYHALPAHDDGQEPYRTHSDYLERRNALFDIIWWGKPDAAMWDAVMKSVVGNRDLSDNDRQTFVGAVCLSLMRRSSQFMAEALMSIATDNNADTRTAARAYVGLAFSLLCDFDYWKVCQPIFGKLKACLDAHPQFAPTLTEAFRCICLSMLTPDIERMVREETIPEIMRTRNELRNRRPDTRTPLDEQEMMELFSENPRLENSMERVTKWIAESADVFLPTFKSLKDFDFFRASANWLTPFDKDNRMLKFCLRNETESVRNRMSDKITNSILCDSDKYSMILSFGHIPAKFKENILNMWSAHIEQADEIRNEAPTDSRSAMRNEMRNEMNHFVQDLYRLFTLHPKRSQFRNCFAAASGIQRSEAFGTLLANAANYEAFGAFFAKHGLYRNALDCYNALCGSKLTVDHLRKAAFCNIRLGNHGRALEQLTQADLLDDTSIWTKRQIAHCLLSQGAPAKALGYLLEAERIDNRNVAVCTALGNCYIRLGRYEDALKKFYFVNYNHPDDIEALRLIVWCHFACRQWDKAAEQWTRLDAKAKSLTADDHIMMGHIELCRGRTEPASAHYADAFDKCKVPAGRERAQMFRQLFMADSALMEQFDVNRNTLLLMMDLAIKT